MNEHNAVDHPKHYNDSPARCDHCGGAIECIVIVEHLGFNLGNAVKYIWRAGLKPGSPVREDLQKARWYLDRAIGTLAKQSPVGAVVSDAPPQEQPKANVEVRVRMCTCGHSYVRHHEWTAVGNHGCTECACTQFVAKAYDLKDNQKLAEQGSLARDGSRQQSPSNLCERLLGGQPCGKFGTWYATEMGYLCLCDDCKAAYGEVRPADRCAWRAGNCDGMAKHLVTYRPDLDKKPPHTLPMCDSCAAIFDPEFGAVGGFSQQFVSRPHRGIRMKTHAVCTWGEGPDVLVCVGADAGWCAYDDRTQNGAGSFCLTAAEARELAHMLLAAAERAEELEKKLQGETP